MHTLDKTMRNKLESTITKAREVAEAASRIALEELGVEKAAPYSYLNEEQKELRRKLRSHGRLLGDIRDSKEETQEIDRLIEEVAYEHWHRMLFAKFLAENQLLMFYEDNDMDNAVAVTLEECEEMAQEIGCDNGWELASKIAAKMLPQIFRTDSPVFMLHFPPEKQKELENLLAELPNEIFIALDSLGWVYQFWQTKKKKEVNDSGNKIGARELPAVTQLFTEPYMVNFLLDNSLGAWWAMRKLTKEDLKTALSEEELRKKASLRGVTLEYLRFSKDEDNCWVPAVDTLKGWPEKLSKLKILDPCCGSGHFLVAVFQMLVPMRMEFEGLSADEACDAVIRDNIHGLEIDQRCVELAAFALALTAWKYPGTEGFRRLPELQIAWCGQSVNIKKDEWLALAEDEPDLKIHLRSLYNLFIDAPIFGSLMNPMDSFEAGSIFEKDWNKVRTILLDKLVKSKSGDDLEVMAQGMEKAFQLLSEKYNWIVTNVPYLGRGKQNDKLMKFCDEIYPESKTDIATVFLERIIKWSAKNGYINVVMPQNWLFLSSYSALRKKLLSSVCWKCVVWIGEGGFDSSAAAGAFTALIGLQNSAIKNKSILSIDVSNIKGSVSKDIALKTNDINKISQDLQLNNPFYRIINDNKYGTKELLEKYCVAYQGLVTGDLFHYILYFWEKESVDENWVWIRGSIEANEELGGMKEILLWEKGQGSLHDYAKKNREQLHDMHESGNLAWGKKGITINRMRNLRASLYFGEHFHNNLAVIIPYSEKLIPAIYEFCRSGEFENEVRKIDKKVSLTNRTLLQVPFELERWEKVAEEKNPNGLSKPYSNDPTQWIFHGHPAYCVAPLQVAVARLLGYRWPAELDENMGLSDEARELIKRCDDLSPFADKDGIVCIPSVRGEASAADRLLNLLSVAYKGVDINAKVSELLTECDHAGKSLESWLRDKFFAQHFKLFRHRPFIWHIWDGLSDGFAVLVNYHKLDKKNLEKLIYTYLGDWITKQKSEVKSGLDGAQEKLAAAENLKRNLELILQGEAPYDIFVRWKPINKQPIGWEPDINDGVRFNIRPFMTVPDVGKKGAGVLRDKPNIKWEKDRGKDTASSPWFKIFNGDRINDYHLTLDEKIRAREEKR